MKVLYVFLYGTADLDSGVEKKIYSKVKALRDLGYETDLVSVNPYSDKDIVVNSTYRVLGIPSSIVYNSHFYKLKIRKAILKILNRLFEESYNKYDRVVFRYPGFSDHRLYKLVSKYGNKIIFEHNTKEAIEMYGDYKEKIKETGFRFSPGFPFWVLDRLLASWINEKIWGAKVRAKVRGGVAVADEIRDYEVTVSPNYDCRIVYNGIDYSAVPLMERTAGSDKNVIKCFMLSGHPLFWHGVDRIITGLEAYKGEVDFRIDLYGSYLPSVVESIKNSKLSKHFRILNYINSKEMTEKLKEYDFAFGSLAPHRTGMIEATPLKVRETLARGFPLVKAYVDPVLDKANELKPFIQTLLIDDSPLSFEDIEKFVNNIREAKISSATIRDLSAKYLEMKYMMKMLGDALDTI